MVSGKITIKNDVQKEVTINIDSDDYEVALLKIMFDVSEIMADMPGEKRTRYQILSAASELGYALACTMGGKNEKSTN